MDFEKLYSKLPDFIKYNRVVLDFFLKIPKKLDKLNKKSRINESHQQLFELMLVHSDFKAKGTLRNIQLLYVELLRFIDNVCNIEFIYFNMIFCLHFIPVGYYGYN
jgi:lipopolysaccharide cholinephosphotransferase